METNLITLFSGAKYKISYKKGYSNIFYNYNIERLKNGTKSDIGLADNGMVGLESCFGVANAALSSKATIETMIDTLTKNPRAILGLKEVNVKEGAEANF